MKKPKAYYQTMNKEKAEEIRHKYFSLRMKQKELASEYGIRQGSVSRIISNMVWN